jgi:hypothetical protein
MKWKVFPRQTIQVLSDILRLQQVLSTAPWSSKAAKQMGKVYLESVEREIPNDSGVYHSSSKFLVEWLKISINFLRRSKSAPIVTAAPVKAPLGGAVAINAVESSDASSVSNSSKIFIQSSVIEEVSTTASMKSSDERSERSGSYDGMEFSA